MPTIIVAKPFNLLLRPNEPLQHFDAGPQDVTDEVANHWYTKEHLASGDAEAEAPAAEEADQAAEVEDDAGGGDDPAPLSDELSDDQGDDTLGAADDEAEQFDPSLADAMTDDELRTYITKRDGKAPHHKLGHDKLVALAKGGVEAEDDEEQAEA